MTTERNDQICKRYLEGATIYQLKEEFGISHERARQIIRKAGIYRAPKAEVGLVDGVVESQAREAFLGINLTDADKDALRALAAERGISMSALTSDMLHDMLAAIRTEGAVPEVAE